MEAMNNFSAHIANYLQPSRSGFGADACGLPARLPAAKDLFIPD